MNGVQNLIRIDLLLIFFCVFLSGVIFSGRRRGKMNEIHSYCYPLLLVTKSKIFG